MTWLSPWRNDASLQTRLVLCLVAAAAAGSLAVFLGWIFDVRALKSVGVGGSPMWPLSAIGYLFLAAGFWMTIAKGRGAAWLLTLPIVISLLALGESMLGVSTGIDDLLFSDQVARSSAVHAGRPTFNSVVTLGLLGIALILARRGSHAASELANLLASAALCFGLFSAVMLLFASTSDTALSASIAPLCCSVIAILLAAAFLIWRHNSGWTLLLTDQRERRPFLGVLLPVVIALPILPTLFERWGAAAPSAPSQAELLGVLCNIAIVGFLLWVAVNRIMRQQAILEQLRLALDVAAIAVTRLDGTITYWSQGCQLLYGWSPAEAIGKRKYELLESRSGMDKTVVARDAEFSELELTEQRRDGSEISTLEISRPLERDYAPPMRVLKMLDISKRVSAVTALRASEARLRSIIETMPDAVVMVDERGLIRNFSAAAERMFGCRRKATIGRSVHLLMPGTEAAKFDGWVRIYLAAGDRHAVGTLGLCARRADGSLFPVELNVGETWLGGERFFTGVVRDISDRHSADQRFSELGTELAHVSRQNEMSELAADLAHELNQPLSATANFLATARILAARGAEGPRVAELLRMGEEQTLRAGAIIRRLRNFLAKSEVEMRPEPVAETLREAVSLVFFGATQLDIAIAFKLDPAADTIFADRIQVQQVMVNLLRNAAQALRATRTRRRKITIETRRVGDMVEIAVRDNGPGLPEALRDPLYPRFATAKGAGMGIGLSISRRIVETHGGTLIGENNPKTGACFRFTLPAVEEIQA